MSSVDFCLAVSQKAMRKKTKIPIAAEADDNLHKEANLAVKGWLLPMRMNRKKKVNALDAEEVVADRWKTRKVVKAWNPAVKNLDSKRRVNPEMSLDVFFLRARPGMKRKITKVKANSEVVEDLGKQANKDLVKKVSHFKIKETLTKASKVRVPLRVEVVHLHVAMPLTRIRINPMLIGHPDMKLTAERKVEICTKKKEPLRVVEATKTYNKAECVQVSRRRNTEQFKITLC